MAAGGTYTAFPLYPQKKEAQANEVASDLSLPANPFLWKLEI
jgi:hypothetical protein